jgi:hypothetical protein
MSRLGAAAAPSGKAEDLIGDATLELERMGVRIPFAAIYADSGL